MLHASMLPMLLSILTTASAVQRRMLYNRTELSIMIPEGRPMTSLPLVALQAHTHFPELQVQILYARANEEFVYTETTLLKLRNEGALVLTPMPSAFFEGTLSKDRYSSMLKSPEFWYYTLTPKILLAQADSWLCNSAHESIRPFLPYHYVGAPWGHLVGECPINGGNGGLSLRDREAMLRVTRTTTDSQDLPEDVFFCNHAAASSMNLAPREVAQHFSREERFPWQSSGQAAEGLFAVHKLVNGQNTGFTKEEVRASFESQCPGVSLMVDAMGRVDGSRGWQESEDLVNRWNQEVRARLILSQRPSNGLVALNLRALLAPSKL